jgi:hypothetical protein
MEITKTCVCGEKKKFKGSGFKTQQALSDFLARHASCAELDTPKGNSNV